MQLLDHGDVTYKASKAALNKLGFGVNMLGSHFALVTYTLIPADCKSSYAYKQAWNGAKNLGTTIQRRRGRGRPSRKGSEVGEAGDARTRAPKALQKLYIAPKVMCQCLYSVEWD